MALKAVHVSDVPDSLAVAVGVPVARPIPKGVGMGIRRGEGEGFVVVGHRGKGMNMVASPDRRMAAVMENSVRSFNEAARFPIDFVEFDVQVTKDDCAVIFHDDIILTEDHGIISEKRITDLSLEEFLSYGLQREVGKVGKSLFRKATDGSVMKWKVEDDDSLCTLEEAFKKVDSRMGFNIELKFDDFLMYSDRELTRTLQVILQVVFEHAKDRAIIFSSFHPDAVRLMSEMQKLYPVFFLTDGGCQVYNDVRRNSLEEAIKLCLAYGLQGIVSEVRGIFRNPSAIPRIKESNLHILTYGQLNNVPEAVYMQHLMGINGVIVDHVEEITVAMSDIIAPSIINSAAAVAAVAAAAAAAGGEEQVTRPNFSQTELSFLLKLIPQLVQH